MSNQTTLKRYLSISLLSFLASLYSLALTDIIVVLLQFNSTERGIESGFSGRTDTWYTIFNNTYLTGNGYPSPVSIDNSWVLASYQSGILFAIPILFITIFKFLREFYFFTKSSSIDSKSFLFFVTLYSLVVSIFNHQLFGITSPISYFFLIWLFSSSDSTINYVAH